MPLTPALFSKKTPALPAAAAILLSLAACEMVVDVPIPEHTPKLAMHLLLENAPREEPVFLGRSESILTSASQQNMPGVANARIVITDANGMVVDSFSAAPGSGPFGGNVDGYYASQHQFTGTPGQQYTVYASAPGFEPIESSTRMPNLVTIGSGSFNQSTSDMYNKRGLLSVTFNDNGSESNFYELYARALDSLQRPMGNNSVFEDNGDPHGGAGDNLVEARFFNTFPDQAFNGQSITISNRVRVNALKYDSLGYPVRTHFVQIVLKNLSRDEYLLRRSLDSYNNAHGNPFAEPVRVYSNMKNGYGVFGSSTTSSFVIPIL